MIRYTSRCKENIALGAIMSKFEYLKLADTVAAEIANGALKPGDRLPPQRSFAYERKIAVSTASRVYTELLRRGLVVGEVGRGTFVSGEARRGIAMPTEPRGARIDLEVNYPILPTQSVMIARSLAGLERPEMLDPALRHASTTGTQTARTIAAEYLAREDWSPAPEQMVFTANGRQCIAAALAALVPTGGRCGVEALTYPFIKGIAARLGVTLVPLAMDEHGVRPDAVQKAHREAPPVGALPSADHPESAGHDDAAGAPRRSHARRRETRSHHHRGHRSTDFSTTSRRWPRSRRTAASSSTAFPRKSRRGCRSASSSPPLLRENVIAAVRSGGWTASGFAFAATQRLMSDGTASELARLKRMDAEQRQKIAFNHLAGFELQTNRKSYHLWLILPSHWRSQTFVAAAARRDIALTPSTTFAVSPGHAPNAIRLALAAPAIEQLDAGLRTLSGMLNAKEEDFDSTE